MNSLLKILLIDDDPAFIKRVKKLLKNDKPNQFKLVNVTSLSTSLDTLKAQTINIILLNLNLVDSHGPDTFRKINKLAFNIPIIILTELENENVAITTIAEGAQDYLIKCAINEDMLTRTINYALKHKYNENVINEYAAIIENADEAIFSLSHDGIIKNWNHAAETIFHYSAQEIIGKSFLNLVLPEHKEDINHILKLIKSGDSVNRYKVRLLDKNKKKIDSLLTIRPIQNQAGTHTGSSVWLQDYTQENLSEQQAAIQLRVTLALAESNHLLNSAHNILKSICEILEFKVGEIWELDPEKDVLYHIASWSNFNIPDELTTLSHDMVFHHDEGIQGKIWTSKQAMWIPDLNKNKTSVRKNLLLKMGLNCCFGFPILFNDELLGVFLFYGHNLEQPKINFVIMFEMISHQIATFMKRERMENDVLYLAQHDILTGLANKSFAENFLQNAIDNAQKTHTMVAFLYLDLDDFKNINDSLGYDNGDLVLQEVAHRLQQSLHETDLVARLGGDEFAIVLTKIKKIEDIDTIAQETLNTITIPFILNEKKFYLTACIGISVYPDDGSDVKKLLIDADLALCNAKQAIHNSYQYSSAERAKVQLKKLMMQSKLHQALEKNEFILYYQPIVNVQSNKIVSVEALIRWKTNEGKIILPNEFIQLSEQSELIILIGEWVLRTACNQMKTWENTKLQTISVNISVQQLSEQFVTTIKKILDETGLSPDRLILEITESTLMQQKDAILNIINSIIKMGVQISIDDFGTGYSSFAYLKNFKFASLKIDQSFITDIHKNPNSASIVEAIIVMAHALNIKTIAEGIETNNELDFLKNKNCDEYQGYYYSKPVPADELTHIINV